MRLIRLMDPRVSILTNSAHDLGLNKSLSNHSFHKGQPSEEDVEEKQPALGRRYGLRGDGSRGSNTMMIPTLTDMKDQEIPMTMNEKRDKLKAQLGKTGTNYSGQDFCQAYISELIKYATNPDTAYPVLYKALLGSFIREMGAGEYFGERALEGSTARSASVATLEDCHFLTLSAEEYNHFIKNKHRLLKEAKHSLLTEKFPGYSSLPEEELWKFQYLFQVAVCH